MTTLICWCSRDSRSPSALYVVSDSRFSWGQGVNWDVGPKIRLRATTPEIFAFAGDVTLAQSIFLRIDISNPRPSTNNGITTDEYFQKFLNSTSSGYPLTQEASNTVLLYARRSGEGMQPDFVVSSFRYGGRQRGWETERHQIPENNSDVVCAFGSGAQIAKAKVREWMQEDVSGRTSRSIFSGFCDALRARSDPRSGGPPQLAGIYRTKFAQEIGVVWNEEFYLRGSLCDEVTERSRFDWHNDLFERCTYDTGTKIDGAQPHAKPYAFRK